MFSAAISSSACSKTSPSGGPSTESPSRMPLPGVIGYPAANLHPPATAPRASASFPARIIRGWNAASGRRYPEGTRDSAHPLPSRAATRFFSRKSPLNSRVRTRSTVSGGIPSARATMPAPTMFARIGLPAATAISLSGAASTRGSPLPSPPAGRSHTTMPAGATEDRMCGRCDRIEGERDVRPPPPRPDRDLPDPDGIRVPPPPDPAHVFLRGVEMMSRGDGKAAEEPAGGVHPLAGPARDADGDVDSHCSSRFSGMMRFDAKFPFGTAVFYFGRKAPPQDLADQRPPATLPAGTPASLPSAGRSRPRASPWRAAAPPRPQGSPSGPGQGSRAPGCG